MPKKPELIVMLTWHDYTVENAQQVFDECKDSMARCWGMKEHSLPVEQMKELYAKMKACGKTTFLEVVAYTEEEGLTGARLAAECDAEKVKFQIDTLEATEAGIDIEELLKQYTGRVPLLHIHDYIIVGESGKIDFEKIIAQGIRSGVKDILLEVSSYSFPPKTCVERSLLNAKNLPSIRF